MVKVISLIDDSLVKIAASILLDGGVIAVPTDTIYGICCLAQNSSAVKRIYDIKGRSFDKPLSICLSEVNQFYKWSKVSVNSEVLNDMLPGPYTFIFKRNNLLNHNLNPGFDNVGIRIPKLAWLLNLIDYLDQPLALTSANKSGFPSTLEVSEFSYLEKDLDLIINGGTLGQTEECRLGSTIIDFSANSDSINEVKTFRVVREGCAFIRTVDILRNKYGFHFK